MLDGAAPACWCRYEGDNCGVVRDDQDDTAAYAIAIVLVIVLLGAVGMVAVVKYVLPLVEGGGIVRSGVGSCCVCQLHRTH